jgi:DNA-binding MarR family transcriptional regulator
MAVAQKVLSLKDIELLIADGEHRGQAIAAVVELAARSAANEDSRTLARLRADLSRLRRRTQSDEVTAAFDGAIAALGSALSQKRLERADERAIRESGALLHEVFDLLDTPRRPKDLIDQTGADPSQIARALRKLERNNAVVQVSGAALSDGRERWYKRVEKSEERIAQRPISALTVDAEALVGLAGIDQDGFVCVYRFQARDFMPDVAKRLADVLEEA